MTCSTCALPAPTRVTNPERTNQASRSQRALGVGLLVGVIAVDQASKAWAWRAVPGTIINPGSTSNVAPVNGWFTGPASGALLDFVNFGLLCLAGAVLVRARRPGALFVSAALMIAGWGSNLLDRLGLHNLTAPGSVRGAVDFIHIGDCYYNVADGFIAAATITFVLAVTLPALRKTAGTVWRPHGRRPGPSRPGRERTAAAILAIAAAVGIDVTIAATEYGGVDYSTAWIHASASRPVPVVATTAGERARLGPARSPWTAAGAAPPNGERFSRLRPDVHPGM